MQRYFAFLRGINLGGRRLEMDRLRALFEELGFANVATFIASGNVVFDTDVGSTAGDAGGDAFAGAALEPRIEAHLAAALGYDVDTFLRTSRELESVAGFDGAPGDDPAWQTHVLFLREPASDDVAAKLHALETDDDRFVPRGREVYWLRRGRLSDSVVTTADLEKALGRAANTMRNMNTVRRIVAKFAVPA
ncbi:MAG TPA: DUF1697 domain-containing protein [Longimicrobiales bacterium]